MQSVLLHKSAFLQKIMDYVTHGYADYCCGYVNSKAALSSALVLSGITRPVWIEIAGRAQSGQGTDVRFLLCTS